MSAVYLVTVSFASQLTSGLVPQFVKVQAVSVIELLGHELCCPEM